MKTDFLNSLIAILIITIIIPGITPNIVSALDEQVGGNSNSDNGNSSSEDLSVGSSSVESSSTDISNTDISSTDKGSSENSNSDKLNSGSSSTDSSSDENSGTGSSNSDESSMGSSSKDSSSTAVSDTESSSSGSSGNDVSGTDSSGDDISITGSSVSDKSSDGSSSTDISSTVSSDTKSSSSGSSDNDISSTGNSGSGKSSIGVSSTGSLSIDKSCNGKSSSDKSSYGSSLSNNKIDNSVSTHKSSGGSSITESSYKVISSEIYFPIVIVNGITSSKSSNSGSSDIRRSTTGAKSSVCSPTDNSCSVSSHTDKASKKCPKTAESKGVENQDFSSDSSGMNYNNSSGMNYNDTDNMSYFYYIYYTSEGIYIIYSDGRYVFYPGSSPLEAVMNLYLTGDTVIEPEENIYAKEHVTRNIISGNPVRFDFVENTTCITYAEFEPLMTFRKTTATAEMLHCLSFFVPEAPAGRIYQYPEILIGNRGAGLPTSLNSGLVGFKVEKTWIKDNNVDESRITLKWYNSNWETLPTEKVGEDNDYVYFESKTPGFSFFAITEDTGK